MMCRRVLALGAILCAGTPAVAGTATTSFQVTATVLAACSVTAGNLAFGNYTGTGGAVTAQSTLHVTCTPGSSYTIALDGGAALDVTAREMNDGSSHDLSYGLYTGNTYTSIWGDGTASTVTQGGTGDGTSQPYTVFGRIPGGQFLPTGGYSDTIGVSVNF